MKIGSSGRRSGTNQRGRAGMSEVTKELLQLMRRDYRITLAEFRMQDRLTLRMLSCGVVGFVLGAALSASIILEFKYWEIYFK